MIALHTPTRLINQKTEKRTVAFLPTESKSGIRDSSMTKTDTLT